MLPIARRRNDFLGSGARCRMSDFGSNVASLGLLLSPSLAFIQMTPLRRCPFEIRLPLTLTEMLIVLRVAAVLCEVKSFLRGPYARWLLAASSSI